MMHMSAVNKFREREYPLNHAKKNRILVPLPYSINRIQNVRESMNSLVRAD